MSERFGTRLALGVKRIWHELRKPRRASRRGVALVIVLGSLSILAVMLTEFQDETSADLGHALSERDGIRAEFAAKSAVNLSRLLIATEPTIRKAVAPIMGALLQSSPQIPVWTYTDEVLGAFNDGEGRKRFAALGGFDLAEGKNLGMDGAGFEVQVVDEDSKLNLNMAAGQNLFAEQRLTGLILGLTGGQQYEGCFQSATRRATFTRVNRFAQLSSTGSTATPTLPPATCPGKTYRQARKTRTTRC